MTKKKDHHREEQLDQALDLLPRELEPPAMLEDRIVRTLKQQGHLAKNGKKRRILLQILPLAATLLLGITLGRFMLVSSGVDSTTAERGRKFLLILREGTDFRERLQAPTEQLVHEYGAWAGQLPKGQLLDAEKLKDAGARLNRRGGQLLNTELVFGSEEYSIAGFFLIRADTMEEALTIGRTCPHLSYGGVVEVREIDPV